MRAIASSSLGKRASKSGSLVVNGENLYSDEESTDTEQSSQMQIDDWYQDEWIASVMKVHAENPTTSFLSELHSRSKNSLYKATFPTRKLEVGYFVRRMVMFYEKLNGISCLIIYKCHTTEQNVCDLLNFRAIGLRIYHSYKL